MDKLKELQRQFGLHELDGINALDALGRWVHYEPGQTILAAGAPSVTLWFIRRGLVRYYYLTSDGKERNKAFYREGEIMGAFSSAMTQADSPFTIEALEPLEAFAIPVDPLFKLVNENHSITLEHNKRLAAAFLRNEQREAMLLSCNAEERIRWLMEREPEWIDRVPQFHLASYLGMEAVSYSRLKRQLLQHDS